MWVGDEKVEAFEGISLKYESIFMIIKRKSKPENLLQLGFLLFYHRMFVLIPVLISIIIIIPISIVLPLLLVVLPLLVVFVMLMMLARLSWSVSYMGSAWPSRSSVAALWARAVLVVSPVMLRILGINMVNIHMVLPADRAIEIV